MLQSRAHILTRRLATAVAAPGPYALVFPGQGSQFVGMGRDLWDAHEPARAVLQEADEALGFGLTKLMFNGPEAELTRTMNAQPAILAHSIALLRVIETQHGPVVENAKFVLGHSLGEYTALTAAHSLSVADAVRLVAERGRAMQECAPSDDVGMCALFPCHLAQAEELVTEIKLSLQDDHACDVANINSPAQIVLSGTKKAMDLACELSKSKGIKRCVPLNVSCPFHSAILAPAKDPLQRALDAVTLAKPSVPLVSNVTAQPTQDPREIKQLLVQHVCARVLWADSVQHCISQGVARFIEIGPRPLMVALIRQTDKTIASSYATTSAEAETLHI